MKAQFTVRLDDETKEKLCSICESEKRSQSNMISLLIEQEYQRKIDEKENMAYVQRLNCREITD